MTTRPPTLNVATTSSTSTQTASPPPPPTTPTNSVSTQTAPPPLPPTTPTNSVSTQTAPSPPTNAVSTQTAAPPAESSQPPPLPTLTYAEAATQASRPLQKSSKGKHRALPRPATPPTPPRPERKLPTNGAITIRSLPTKFKVGELRRWLQEDNRDLTITGARWLLSEDRRAGKTHSSLVVYLHKPTEAPKLRMGRKSYRTTTYDRDRPSRTST